ncbi:MAG: DUF4623 domain-containing protein [Ignavibacteriaceae bacterium]|nr:DUF4623 domain-containing protein [Ignavibacteriaceae bacterium]
MRLITLSFFLLLLSSFPQKTYSQDSTKTLVGPGFYYHSVYKTSGPFNIKILEIDISQPKNKLKTVLAKDVLGQGFEKTSSMAARSSRSGNIVIGAVNGDFFGISNSSNPYTFLTGSQITNREYAQGHTNKRPSVAFRPDNKVIFDDLGFGGNVTSVSDSVFSLTGFNDTVKANGLILYNKFMGTSTKTAGNVTEIKLKPVDEFAVNQINKFVVQSKVSGTGNMSFTETEYVLSGRGNAKAYLDSLVFTGDTLRIRINSNPSRGDLVELISGSPRMITNGVINSGIDPNVHPRTAVGLNQDSTRFYLVTVDGRQAGFSVGMSLPQMAAYMLSIGCYQALNLDGGGSTTMVIRGKVVNSPSDAGGERSCGNALLAVLEIESRDITDSLDLKPESIFMDSTQTKKINVGGVDLYGYPVELRATDIVWEVRGIQGSVDSLGFFKPSSTGSGYIIGRLNNLADTIAVTVTGNIIPVWTLCDATNNLPSWFSATGNTERGLGYSKFTNHLYVVNRPNLSILNADNGDLLGTMNQSGITGGTYTLNDVDVTDDGIIVAANLTTGANSTPFKVYKWASESAQPEEIINYSAAAYRLGDKFTITGSFADSSAVVYAAVNSSNKVLKWRMSGTGFNQTPTEITLSGFTNSGTNPSVTRRTGSTNIIVNGNSILPREHTDAGVTVSTLPANLIDSRSNAIRYFEASGRKFIATFQYGFPNENAKVLDITNGLASAVLFETTPSLGDNINTTGASGDVALRHYQDNIYILYVLATNNGIGAHQLTIDSLITSTEEEILAPDEFYLFQNYPNPFNPATTIKYQVPDASHVRISVYNILGEKIALLVDNESPQGTFFTSWDASGYSSGLYFYEMEAGEYRSVKKLSLIK